MNCVEVQKCLSLFYDNQLSPGKSAQVAAHITECALCTKELESFQQLSGLSRQLSAPQAPDQLWENLRSKLDSPEEPSVVLARVGRRQIPSRFIPSRLMVLAATVLIAVGIGLVAYQIGKSPAQKHLAINFAHYLENFSEQPDKAQQVLLTNYQGQATTIEEAAEILGYKPVTARGLPAGCSLDKVYLLKMPCCTCPQVICTSKDGNPIAIFEHAIDQPVWFGDRPSKKCLCDEVPTDVKQIGDQLAATWKEGDRYITIIGAADLEEVSEFVAHFKGAG